MLNICPKAFDEIEAAWVRALRLRGPEEKAVSLSLRCLRKAQRTVQVDRPDLHCKESWGT